MKDALLVELKARKRKYGFRHDFVRLESMIPLGKLLESLQNTWAAEDYLAEMVGMSQNNFRLYTDKDDVAAWIRANWCI